MMTVKVRKIMRTLAITSLMVSGILAAGLIGGCGKEDDQPQHRSVKGRVSEINKQTGEVGMIWYNKKGEPKPLKGKLAQGAEILINGRTKSLDDVLIDDEVEVIGTVSGTGDSQQLIATQVNITRIEDSDDQAPGGDSDQGSDQEEQPKPDSAAQ